METTVLIEDRGSVRVITLNRPDKLNAFNEAQHQALNSALDASAQEDTVRCVLLTGAGRGFCAGQDLSDRVRPAGGEAPDLGATLDRFYNPNIRLIRSMKKPVVCAVNGVAAGAGANIALACDIVIAARSATFVQAFSKIGLIPDSGGTWYLPRLIGEARAKALIMLAEPVKADDAERMGMIWKSVDDSALMNEAMALAARLAEAPTVGLGLSKMALQASQTNTLDQQLDLERDLQRTAGRTADYAEGVRAFMDKRKPVFTGKA